MKKIFLISAILMLSSCNHYDQKMKLEIVMPKQKPAVTNSKTFELTVVDQRKDADVLGTKQFGEEKIEITSNQNLALFLQNELSENLLQKGFQFGKNKKVEIAIKSFGYKAERAFVGKSKVDINLQITVKNNQTGKKFTRNLELSSSRKHFIAPLETTDAKSINAILKEAVQNILSDEAFLQSLAE
jgi:uncharacterized lipoprotein YajG